MSHNDNSNDNANSNDREILLEHLRNGELANNTISVEHAGDIRNYTLLEPLSGGKTGVAWKAIAHENNDLFAIKFTLIKEYAGHTLRSERENLKKLNNRDLFAQIPCVGKVSLKEEGQSIGLKSIPWQFFYVTVVEWVEGESLKSFLQQPNQIDPELFLQLAKDLCGVIHLLSVNKLTHHDLHDENILITSIQISPFDNKKSYRIKVIDTGQLKSIEQKEAMLAHWKEKEKWFIEDAPFSLSGETLDDEQKVYLDKKEVLTERVNWFERTDQEWVVCHLCQMYNRMRKSLDQYGLADRRFILGLPTIFQRMLDNNLERRLDNGHQIHQELQRHRDQTFQINSSQIKSMNTPFELSSAELIRDDQQLMELLSNAYPDAEICRSMQPVYICGPRGCGKSTILRSLSFKAILASGKARDELDKVPFIGVYLSVSQKLRSRFWLFNDEDFEYLKAPIIRYFILLLVESLVQTLEEILKYDSKKKDFTLGFSKDIGEKCATVIRETLQLEQTSKSYAGISGLHTVKRDIFEEMSKTWSQIIEKKPIANLPDAELIFTLVKKLEKTSSLLKKRTIAFLIDDYSNQRIPAALQKQLNQTIAFARRKSPIFKVTSEYNGLDLEGIDKSREFYEINIGDKYVELTDPDDGGSARKITSSQKKKKQFLRNVLEKRFAHLDKEVDFEKLFPPCGKTAGAPLAEEIRQCSEDKGSRKKFYYHGIDTIENICSGDFATGIELVSRIISGSGNRWDKLEGVEISPSKQHEAIREFADEKIEYIRYQTDGIRKYEVIDQLCRLSHKIIIDFPLSGKKDRPPRPQVKTSLDIQNQVIHELEEMHPDLSKMWSELVTSGALFPLKDSRSKRGGGATTSRFMIRRIFLTRHNAALARGTPITVDDLMALHELMLNPKGYVDSYMEKAKISDKISDKNKGYKKNLLSDLEGKE